MGTNNNNEESNVERPFDAYEGDEPYIFVSYAHKDANIIFPEIKRFHDKGYPIWYDQGLTPGQEWDDEIAEALLGCSLLVVFISKNSMDSTNVQDEIKLALEEKIDVVPIYLEKTKLPSGLRLRLSNKHAILKYSENISDDNYIQDCFKAFKKANINKIGWAEYKQDKIIEDKIYEEKESHIKSNIQINNTSLNFTYLDELIHSGQKEIKLEEDIILEDGEETKYTEGILVDVDNITIDGNNFLIDAREKTRIFKSTGKNITIKNTKILNGYANEGGAIYNEGTLTLTNITLTKNKAKCNGGAVHNNEGNLSIIDTTIDNNKSEKSAGAIYNYYGDITIENSTLHYNRAYGKKWKYCGGAIRNMGKLTIKNSILNNNKAEYDGGAIYNVYNHNVIIIDCTLNNNAVKNAGGVIRNCGNLNINNSTLNNNEAGYHGGAIFNGHSNNDSINLTIDNCIINNNTSKGSGGAIYNWPDGIVTLTKSTLTKNTSKGYGGAVFNEDNGLITVKESTLEQNLAYSAGGAISTKNKMDIQLNNCDVTDNRPDDLHDFKKTSEDKQEDKIGLFNEKPSNNKNKSRLFGFLKR